MFWRPTEYRQVSCSDEESVLSCSDDFSWETSDTICSQENLNWSAGESKAPLLEWGKTVKTKSSSKRPVESDDDETSSWSLNETRESKSSLKDRFLEFFRFRSKSHSSKYAQIAVHKGKGRTAPRRATPLPNRPKGKAQGTKANNRFFNFCRRKAKSNSFKDKSNNAQKSASSSSPPGRRNGRKRYGRGLLGYARLVIKSDPDKHGLVKAIVGLPIGLLIATGLFFVVVRPLELGPGVRNVVGSVMGLFLSIGFAFSVQIRCIVMLVVPIFFGRAGRTFVAAYALLFLLSGPVENIIDNCREVVRSLSCLAQLLANHTVAKWKLRLNPIKEALEDLQEEGFMIQRISGTIRSAFAPIVQELEDHLESDAIDKQLAKVRKLVQKSKEISPLNPFSVAQLKQKSSKLTDFASQAIAVQEKWRKKLELRCNDVFGNALVKCRDFFGDLHKKCMDALWVLGHVLCLPLKLTIFCNVVKLVPAILGLNCDSMNILETGFGKMYLSAKEMIAEVANGLKINLQYRLTSLLKYGPNLMTAEALRIGAMLQFETKVDWLKFFVLLLKRCVAFAFLLVFRTAYLYQKGFLTKFQHDNIYVTAYFRRIDARRHALGKLTLLPLKKAEKQTLIFPTSLKPMQREKRDMVIGCATLVFRVIISILIVYVDYVLAWLLDLINRHSRIEYHQTGEHLVNVTVNGTGFMSDIVRTFLTAFNSHKKLDSITTNDYCLPKANQPDVGRITLLFLIYFAVFIFLALEAYGQRMRRLICAFFYRKREKRRILYLYNEMLKKRKGFLRHMRHRIRKEIRHRTLKGQTGVLTALTLQFPRLCRCLKWFKWARESCLICKEPEGKTFQYCPTPGCNWGYCSECWKDIKRRCYACGGKADGESGSDPSDIEEDESSDTSEVTDDEKFLK